MTAGFARRRSTCSSKPPRKGTRPRRAGLRRRLAGLTLSPVCDPADGRVRAGGRRVHAASSSSDRSRGAPAALAARLAGSGHAT